jgi:hypothetical protein
MLALKIKRSRVSSIDPKQTLRAHVDQLPLDQQHEFVSLALRLIATRTDIDDDVNKGGFPQPTQDVMH